MRRWYDDGLNIEMEISRKPSDSLTEARALSFGGLELIYRPIGDYSRLLRGMNGNRKVKLNPEILEKIDYAIKGIALELLIHNASIEAASKAHDAIRRLVPVRLEGRIPVRYLIRWRAYADILASYIVIREDGEKNRLLMTDEQTIESRKRAIARAA